MDGRLPALVGVTPPARSGGQHHRKSRGAISTVNSNGVRSGKRVRKMTAIMSSSRARSTWLTGAAGLLMLAAAFVMMVCAAPRIHAVRHESVTRDQLASWTWTNPETPEHWVRVTPGSNHGFTRSVWAPVP